MGGCNGSFCRQVHARDDAADLLEVGSQADHLAQDFRRSEGIKYRYGTAGFRADAKILDSVMLRMGMMSAILARRRPGKAIGIMITASHNKEKDNGVKLADFDGGMLNTSWESKASEIANCDEEKLVHLLTRMCRDSGLKLSAESTVYVGEDTRSSSPRLAEITVKGALALGAKVKRLGACTTPQLHWCVWRNNVIGRADFIDGYYAELSAAFLELCRGIAVEVKSPVVPAIKVDCANGVGTLSAEKLAPLLKDCLSISVFNTDTNGTGKLNEGCGAEHVQKARELPFGVDAKAEAMMPFCSLDGDADRIVFFYPDPSSPEKMCLQDGDKIAALITEVLRDLLKTSGLLSSQQLSVGVVQTAYANGASTAYLSSRLGSKSVLCAKTGVKHLHKKALVLDVGVYFEANGHGTVIFSQKALEAIESANPKQGSAAAKAVRRLKCFLRLINQAIGDALSDMLVVVAALRIKGWSLQDWAKIYTDLPSRMLKCKVRDRTLVRTTDAERTCVAPAGLQSKIDEIVAEAGEGARSFVRPSGTEDVVRIYAEASTQAGADRLAERVKLVVEQMLA